MALDKDYFDAITIDVAKKKYYNINKVEAVLQDIRREAEAMNEENARLRSELEQMKLEKSSVGDALIAARELARQITDDAKAKADKMVREAETRRNELLGGIDEEKGKLLDEALEERDRIKEESRRQENYAAQYMVEVFDRLKEQQLAAVKQLDEEFRTFLCGLFPEEDAPAAEEKPVSAERHAAPAAETAEAVGETGDAEDTEDTEDTENDDDALDNLETIPEDLREKVSAIAKALRSISGE